jgi:O-antigen ligase
MSPAGVASVLFFALLPAVASGGGMALPVVLCFAGAASVRPSLLRQAVENKPAALALLLAFVAWAAITGLWSPHAGSTQALKLLVLVPLGLAFASTAAADDGARRLTRAGSLAAFLVLAPLMAIEAIWNLPLNRIAQPEASVGELIRNASRGATILLAMGWAAAAGLFALGGRRRTFAAALVLAMSGFIAFQFGQMAHAAAFMAGLAAFGAAYAAPRLAILAASAALAAWMLLAPFLTPIVLSNQRLVDALPESWAARAGIWRYVCARIVEQPWIGHGLDASRAVADRIDVRGLDMRAVPLHPHSASLQIWFETGLVGALLGAATLVIAGRALARMFGGERAAAAAACATLVSLGLVANVSYGVWQEWWNAAMFVAAAMVGAVVIGSRARTAS